MKCGRKQRGHNDREGGTKMNQREEICEKDVW